MARRILNNAKTIISYDKNDDITRIQYENARDAMVIFSDETFVEFDGPKGKDSIQMKDLIILIDKEKDKEKEKENNEKYKEKAKAKDKEKKTK